MIHTSIIRMRKFVSVALGFSIPVSTALNSLFLFLIIPLWFLGRNYRNVLSLIKNNKYVWAILIFVGLYFFGIFYSEAGVKEALDEFSSVANLLLIPMMIPFFRDEKVRNAALNLFLITMTIVLFLSYLIWFDLIPANQYIKGNSNDASVFMGRITQNLLMAFCAFLFAVRARQSNDWRGKLLFIVLTVLAVINIVIMVGGKTGYVVLIVLTIYYFLNWLRWKGVLLAVVAVAVFGIFTYLSPSSGMHKQLNEFFKDVSEIDLFDLHTQEFRVTSAGYRIMFYKNTMKIILENPVWGVGTGGFTKAYARKIDNTKMPITDNPHNEYMMVTSQLGLLGLFAFLYLFFTQWRQASNLHSKFDKIAVRGLVLTVLSASMVTSTLMDNTEMTFYIWMSALLFGGCISYRCQEDHNEIISNHHNEK